MTTVWQFVGFALGLCVVGLVGRFLWNALSPKTPGRPDRK
jgi:hypothetical protein